MTTRLNHRSEGFYLEDQPRDSAEQPQAEMPGDNGELPVFAQRRNSLVFILNNSIGYFVAPVFYVGVLHAAILKDLKYSDTIANLPESVYLWALPLPVVIAWIWPSTHYLRRMMVINYISKAAAGLVAAALFYLAPGWLAVGIVAHAAVVGVTSGVNNMCLWELIGRGMTPARRGWTLGVTFGLGPIFAVLGSGASDAILRGVEISNWIRIAPIKAPLCYVVLFGATCPAMLLAAACVFLAHLPGKSSAEPEVGVAGVVEGLRQYFTYRLILIAACGFLLTSAGGNLIMNNVGLLAEEISGEAAVKYAGVQSELRFGCKSLFGFVLGWILARYQAKAAALSTTLICLAGVVWALVVPGKWYLFSFGLLGAGELYYVYYLNYIVGCSAPERIRENTAYTNLVMVIVSFMPLIYGLISDRFGLRTSLGLAIAILIVAFVGVWSLLPWRPQPPTSAAVE